MKSEVLSRRQTMASPLVLPETLNITPIPFLHYMLTGVFLPKLYNFREKRKTVDGTFAQTLITSSKNPSLAVVEPGACPRPCVSESNMFSFL